MNTKKHILKRLTNIISVANVWRGIGVSKQTYFNAINCKDNGLIELHQKKINKLLDSILKDLRTIKKELNAKD